jgi:crotonobetainyl-CoA:carnitine CoA-transferase CaiB-like acyl-CoA transferase
MKLAGLRVVDLSLFLPGPFMTLMMADHGAEVIKVEPPGGGDPARAIGQQQEGCSVFFRNANRGKKSVVLNLKSDAGREALLDLCASADVFVEGFRPGVVQRLGVDYDTVRERRPDIVYCSISAFGQSGPYRNRPAHDLANQSLAGFVSLNVGSDGRPAMPAIPAADLAAAHTALGAVLMALYRRVQTGEGDYVDIAMQDSLLSWAPNVLGPVFAEDRSPRPGLERTLGGGAFYRIYETADGRYISLAGQEPKFVRNLLTEFDRMDLAELCERGPGAHQQPVIDFLADKFLQKTRDEWNTWFEGRDICYAPVLSLKEAHEDPHAQARGMALTADDGLRHVGNPMHFSAEPAQPDYAPPGYGEHTREVFAQLGYGEEQLQGLDGNSTGR